MNQPKRRRMLIVDVDSTPVFQTPVVEAPRRLTKQELHAQVQREMIDAAARYKYEIGLYEEFEAPIWMRVDLILKARTLDDAERAAAEAMEFGLLRICVWQKKVKR